MIRRLRTIHDFAGRLPGNALSSRLVVVTGRGAPHKTLGSRIAMTRHAYKLADWTVYPDSNELTRDRQSKRLESRVMQLLVYFCDNPNRVINQEELLQEIWGRSEVSANSVSVAITAIRKALEDDARTPHFIETHKNLGYRLRVTPKRLEVNVSRYFRRQWLYFGIAAVFVSGVLVTWLWIPHQSRSDSTGFAITLQPFENGTNSSEHDEIAETIGDVLIAELAQHDQLIIRRQIPGELARALDLKEGAETSSAFLYGRVIQQHDELVLATYLEERESNEVIWAQQTTIDTDHLLVGVSAIADGLLQDLQLRDTGAINEIDRNDKAVTLYQQARLLAATVSNVTIKLAHSLLLEAVASDPQYAPAHALLAEMYSWHYPPSFWGLRGDRFELAERELELAKDLGADKAYTLVTEAGIYLARDRNYQMARDVLRQAAELRPNDPWVLRPQIWANMLLGDFAAALDYNKRAAESSLDSRSVLLERIVPLYYLGRFEEVLRLHEATVELGLKPSYHGAHAAIVSGDQTRGFQYWVRFIRYQGVDIEDESEPLRWARQGDLCSAYDWLRSRSGKFLLDWNYPLASASWHLACGDHDQAVAEVSAAIRVYRTEQEPTGNPGYNWTLFFYDPLFEKVRHDERLVSDLELLRSGK